MKIAITGCNGSVGKRVVFVALARGHTVVGMDNSDLSEPLQSERFQFIKVDLRDYEEILKSLAGCEAIVHLAGQSFTNDRYYLHGSALTLQPSVPKSHRLSSRSPQQVHTEARGLTNLGLISVSSNVVISWNVLRGAAEVHKALIPRNTH